MSRDLAGPGMKWKSYNEVDKFILTSKVTHYTEVEGGEWIENKELDLTMKAARRRMLRMECWAAIRNKDGMIYDRILEKLEHPAWERRIN